MMTNLLGCPFCGADGHLLIVGEWLRAKWFVSCNACDSDGPAGRDRTSAVDAWNRRASLPAPQGERPVEPSALRPDIDAFLVALPGLRAAHMWKYVVFHGGRLRAIREDYKSALKYGYATFGTDKPFIVQRVEPPVASQDSRPANVAPGGQPLAQPNSQDGDSVSAPVEPSGATLSPCADVVREFAADLRQLALLAAANRGIPLAIPASISRQMHAFMLGKPSLFDRIVGAPQVDRGESSSEGGGS